MTQTCLLCKNIINNVHFNIDENYTKHSNVLLRAILERIFENRIVLSSSKFQICVICTDSLNELDLAESTCKRIKQKILNYFDLKCSNTKLNAYCQTDVFIENVLEFDVHGNNKTVNEEISTTHCCHSIDKTNETKNKLKNEVKRFECLVCFRIFSTKSGLTLHVKKLHNNVLSSTKNGSTNFKTETTDFELNHLESFDSEFKLENLELETALPFNNSELNGNKTLPRNNRTKKMRLKKSFKCSQCCKTWKTLGELKNHLSAHSNDRPFICEVCGQAYKHKTALDIHVGMHNGINPFVCSYCKKCFTQKGALQRHLPIHTGETPYQCDLCGKRFIHHTSFNIHQLSHNGQKDYKCSECGLALLSGSHLKRHMRVHTGERNYACPVCGKRFAERYNLVSHQKLHENPKSNVSIKRNHRCQICGITYNRKLKLDEHMAREHQRVTETNVPLIQNLFMKTDNNSMWVSCNGGLKETVQSTC